MTNDVFGIFCFNHVLRKDMAFSLIKIKYMNLKWKNQQFINYSNRIATNTLKYVGERLVKCSN